jgi:nucleoside-diphosphate-sugar epimerase
MNIGSGIPTSFRDVAYRAIALAGSTADIELAEDKPEGVRNRYADTEEMERWYHPRVTLEEGLVRMIEYRRAMLRIGR